LWGKDMPEKTSTKDATKEDLTRIELIRDGNLLTELSNLAPKDCEPLNYKNWSVIF
jgi:hypothetical protein